MRRLSDWSAGTQDSGRGVRYAARAPQGQPVDDKDRIVSLDIVEEIRQRLLCHFEFGIQAHALQGLAIAPIDALHIFELGDVPRCADRRPSARR